MVKVVAGILERDGRVLICRRRADQAHALQWEFPGGKVEPGETAAAALRRELQEELDVHVVAAREITSYEYQYPGKNKILLIFFRVGECRGEPRNVIFHEMRWENPEKLAEFDFVEGDRKFIEGWGAWNVELPTVPRAT
jgi:8-oxo-dGTP diphosphatase